MADGTTVSGSRDMALVRWDKEEKNFEAITRIVGVSQTHQALTCMTAFDANVVLCGSMAGSILAVDCASGVQVAALRGHTSRVNALVVMEDLLFSASEDGYVNVWNTRSDEPRPALAFQQSCKLLKRIPVQLAVRDMVPHEGSRSLWVSYADGLVERWSANPDDDFGVEQVIREAFINPNESQTQRHEVVSLQCVGTLETMRVLALGSNGVSKVWCGHRNVVEDALQHSINQMHDIITQDTTEAAAWEQKAIALKRKEVQRKQKYSALLSRLHARRLLFGYYTRWRMRLKSHLLRGRQQEEICLNLEERHQFHLLRRYFAMWCGFYDREQRRLRRQLIALALERFSHLSWVARVLSRWKEAVSCRKMRRQQDKVLTVLTRVSTGVLLSKFFARWRCYGNMRRGTLPEGKLAIVVAKARQRVMRQAYEDWTLAHAQRVAKKATVSSGEAGPITKRAPYAGGFAEAYAKVTMERERRRIFTAWRRWYDRRRRMISLRAMATAKEAHSHRITMQRRFLFWQLFCQQRRLDTLAREVQDVEARLRLAEETHADIFDKLQLQKRVDQLRRQHEAERRQLQEDLARAQKLIAERDVIRRSLDRGDGIGADDEISGTASHTLFAPSVLRQLPVEEAMAFVMTRLKGIVLNTYTDMPLFRQIKDRLRCGTTAAVVFLEGFHEVKRLVVNLSKKPVGATWRSGERWPLHTEALEGLPLHPCTTVVQAIKAMVVAYDMVGVADVESVAATREEIVANADLLFALWRACYAARKPTLPVNNRVSGRS
ncbi:hypothetical protein DQ04_01581000 [Trypanosoma grayi]|uniref:hypothetical protein n=1 Tax=Trypanosoma grayi TaxID=71804 RepID=UPI0004F46C8A|nr:hypothetical protein DQ04_01581000 [Trypanosoma grayi]KEG12603.1 hypothetical protein DQ04_01581000 [Trypanosoma grayi]